MRNDVPAPVPSNQGPSWMSPLARTDAQLKAMRKMHERMMAAKSAEERSRLMSERMKMMQSMMTRLQDRMPPVPSM